MIKKVHIIFSSSIVLLLYGTTVDTVRNFK